jgi:hypothetical protein
MGSQRQPEPGENIKGGTTPQLLGGVGAFVAPKKRGRGASQRTKKSCTNTSKKQLAQTARARRKPAHQKKTVQTRPKNSWHKTTKTARARRKPAHQKNAVNHAQKMEAAQAKQQSYALASFMTYDASSCQESLGSVLLSSKEKRRS